MAAQPIFAPFLTAAMKPPSQANQAKIEPNEK
jgi:hypothetical protein